MVGKLIVTDSDKVKDGIIEGLINAVISAVIILPIYFLNSGSVGIDFLLIAVALTAFFTGYFTLTTGGVTYYSEK